MKDTELAWAAGIVDGEGCIYIARTLDKKRGYESYQLYLRVVMAHAETIARLHSLFGVGTLHTERRPNPKHSIIYGWNCGSQSAKIVSPLVRPFLFTKAEQADIALTFSALPRASVKVPDDRIERQRLYWLLKECKGNAARLPQ